MSILSRLFVAINKRNKALEEGIDLKNYINPHAFKAAKESTPFSHVVIDNFFKEDFVIKLQQHYNELLSKGLSSSPSEEARFRPFEEKINYDGYVFSPSPTLEEPLKLFFSVNWNMFFSKIFHKPTTLGTNFAFHHHPKGDRTGWVHNDYATYFFPHKLVLSNGVNATKDKEGDVQLTRAESQVKSLKQKRAIAIIYYFNNPEWKEGDGGETGIYSSKESSSLVKNIAPINNRILAFDVSPESYHAFQENLKERNTFVQWFHTDLEWSEKKYGFL